MMSFREKDGPSSNNRNKDEEEEDESNKNQSGVGRGRASASAAAASSSNNSRQWSSAGLKNPRIVRVSRSFGGKDRHSKVCTIKGLRDRRIRLSVPTAIQLYDLQDRLGLSQPSKVIDWLLDTTKHDIDKLPPLPIIPNSSFSQGYGLPFASSSTPFFFDNASLFPPRKDVDTGGSGGGGGGANGGGGGASAGVGININSSSTSTRDQVDAHMDEDEDEEESLVAKLRYWGSTNNAMMRSKHRGVDDHINQDQNQGGNSQVLAQNLFPIASHNTNSANNVLPPHPHPHPTNFLSNNNPMFNYYHLEPSNLSLAQLGNLGLSSSSSHNDIHQGSSSHHQSNSATQPPSSLSLSSMSPLFLCPSMATTSFFPQQHQASFMSSSSHHHHQQHHPQVENDLQNQFNRFPISNNPFSSNFHNSSGLDSKPFPLSMNHEPRLQQGDEDGNREGKSGSGHTLWKEP